MEISDYTRKLLKEQAIEIINQSHRNAYTYLIEKDGVRRWITWDELMHLAYGEVSFEV